MKTLRIMVLALFASLWSVGTVYAGVSATAFIQFQNFVIRGSDGEILDADTDFVTNSLVFTNGADEDVSLDAATDSRNIPNSTTGIDFPESVWVIALRSWTTRFPC